MRVSSTYTYAYAYTHVYVYTHTYTHTRHIYARMVLEIDTFPRRGLVNEDE